MRMTGPIRRWALGLCCLALLTWCGTRKREDRVLAQFAVPSATSWPLYRGTSQQLGVAPGKLASRLKVVWKFRTGGPVTSSPVVTGGRVFVGSGDSTIYGLRLGDSKKISAFKPCDAVDAPPCAVGR